MAIIRHPFPSASGTGSPARYGTMIGSKSGKFYTSGQDIFQQPLVYQTLYAVPVTFPVGVTLAEDDVQVTTAGAAGAVVRLGIYKDDGSGFPGALLGDFGTVSAVGTGTKTLATSQVVPAGTYWMAACWQVTSSTTVQMDCGIEGYFAGASADVTTLRGNNMQAMAATGVAGALPTPFPTSATPSAIGVQHYIKVA